ncbi:50S ribosomal protein L2 [Candidatus Woesearchaeota archaeon]|nr:50S ribosomal protein L2 [Candidatus Woesearchaeota archaeon]
MGKRIITQRRGKGSNTYKAASHRYLGELQYRKFDEKEKTDSVYGKIVDLVHSVGHSAPLAKVKYQDEKGSEVLVPAPLNVKVGDIVAAGSTAQVQAGNVLPLRQIPEGTLIYQLEVNPGDGGKLVRSAGSFARVLAHVGENTIVKLPSKKDKTLNGSCRATIGVIAGGGRKDKPIVKAGKMMHMMRARNKLYPRTSGVAMNSVDHPFGSGRGRHIGKPRTPPRYAPAGRNVGLLHARKTGRGK